MATKRAFIVKVQDNFGILGDECKKSDGKSHHYALMAVNDNDEGSASTMALHILEIVYVCSKSISGFLKVQTERFEKTVLLKKM